MEGGDGVTVQWDKTQPSIWVDLGRSGSIWVGSPWFSDQIQVHIHTQPHVEPPQFTHAVGLAVLIIDFVLHKLCMNIKTIKVLSAFFLVFLPSYLFKHSLCSFCQKKGIFFVFFVCKHVMTSSL